MRGRDVCAISGKSDVGPIAFFSRDTNFSGSRSLPRIFLQFSIINKLIIQNKRDLCNVHGKGTE